MEVKEEKVDLEVKAGGRGQGGGASLVQRERPIIERNQTRILMSWTLMTEGEVLPPCIFPLPC